MDDLKLIDVISYLKDNLSIEILKISYGYNENELKVKLILNGCVISEDQVSV